MDFSFIDSLMGLMGLGGGAAGGGYAFFQSKANKESVKEIKQEIGKMEEQLTNHQIKVAEQYVTNSHFNEGVTDLKSYLIRIEEKIDKKADK